MRPTLLWHYTDHEGLLGIVQSSTLRLGDRRYLNDRTELSFARLIISRALAAVAGDSSDDLMKRAASIFSIPTSRGDAVYVASVSEVGDSISQWQRYGANGYGYAIGFEADVLASQMCVGTRPIELQRILYDEKRQRGTVRSVVSRFVRSEARLMSELSVSAKEWERLRPFALMLRIEEIAARIKNPSFSDEREWRFVCSLKSGETVIPIDFCARGAYVRPFISAVPIKAGTLLPIRRVICGPRLDADIAVEPIRQLLNLKGFVDFTVEHSSLADVWR